MAGLMALVRDMAARTPEGRERSVDMLRAFAICMVVYGHWFVIAVTYENGELAGLNALNALTWIDLVTWVFQVMPIFFFVGGYAGAASLASHYAAGGDGVGWVLRRTDRLLRPTTALFVVFPLVTIVAVAGGIDQELLGTVAWLASIPLWFMLAYVGMVVLTPWLYALHRRAGLAVPVVLVVVVGVGDLLRMRFDVPLVGETTHLFAWLAVYQLGICWRDGRLRLSTGAALALAGGGLVALIGLTSYGPYDVAMVGYNTNPPTLALMALAATQVGLVLAIRPAANRWLRRAGPWSAVIAINAVILTVFLWHMTAAVIAAVALFPTGLMAQPDVNSGAWMLWRLPWLAACTVVLLVLVAVFGRIETRRSVLPRVERSAWRDGCTAIGIAAVLAGLFVVAQSGPDYHGPLGLPWVSVALYLVGAAMLRMTRNPPARSATRRASD